MSASCWGVTYSLMEMERNRLASMSLNETPLSCADKRDRLVQQGPALRPHINVYVDRERGGLDSTLRPASRVDVIAAISGG